MTFCTGFGGYDAGIMTVILADKQFAEYYNIDANKRGLVATIPWPMTGESNALANRYSFRLLDFFRGCPGVPWRYAFQLAWASLDPTFVYFHHDYRSVSVHVYAPRG